MFYQYSIYTHGEWIHSQEKDEIMGDSSDVRNKRKWQKIILHYTGDKSKTQTLEVNAFYANVKVGTWHGITISIIEGNKAYIDLVVNTFLSHLCWFTKQPYYAHFLLNNTSDSF